MNPFGKLKSEGLEQSQDRLGGFSARETDVYSGTIKMMYGGKSDAGAGNVTVILDLPGGEYRETVYVTNKEGDNWFIPPNAEKDANGKPKKVALPGFTVIDEICMIASGAPLSEQEFEERVVKVYDFKERKEINQTVLAMPNVIGQPISVGIVKILENKKVKGDDNKYVATAEERTTNVIEKVFDTETKLTMPEYRQGLEKGVFWDMWVGKNKGQVRDKRTIKDGVGAPAAGSGRMGAGRPSTPPVAQGNGQSQARKSLFGGGKAA